MFWKMASDFQGQIQCQRILNVQGFLTVSPLELGREKAELALCLGIPAQPSLALIFHHVPLLLVYVLPWSLY